MEIHVVETLNLTKEQKARLEKLGKVKYFEGLPDVDQFLERVEGADIVALDWAPVDEAIPRMKKGVKLIALPYTGIGFLPLKEAAARGIKFANAPDSYTEGVGEFSVGLILALVRRIYLYARGDSEKPTTPTLYGRTIGILGAGHIGRYVGKVAEALGMKVIYWKRGDDLTKVLKSSDVLFCALPESNETKGLLGKKEFSLMKKGSYFVTISPRSIFDPDALLEALDDNLAGAAMDMAEYKGASYLKLKQHPKFLLTPHVAYKTDYGIKRSFDIMIDDIEAFAKGKPINIVN
jgi:D-3-phosphoglycerate dehydrogenase